VIVFFFSSLSYFYIVNDVHYFSYKKASEKSGETEVTASWDFSFQVRNQQGSCSIECCRDQKLILMNFCSDSGLGS